MKNRIGSHPMFDDRKYWEFARRSGLDRADFRLRWWEQLRIANPDALVVGATLICLFLGLAAVWIAEMP